VPGRLYLPDEVKTAITAHIRDAEARAVDAYESGVEDEDVLTGQLGAYLRIGTQRVAVSNSEIGGEWTWSIDYRKFRGRGPGATEKILGADGIFELRLHGIGRGIKKSLMFQAKNEWSSDQRLLDQVVKLSTWREAACVIDFRSGSIDVYTLDAIVRSRGVRGDGSNAESLGSFLGTRYLNCDVGDTELAYDAKRRQLMWTSMGGRRVATSFSVGERIRIDVSAPRNMSQELGELLVISNSDVHKHRMYVNPRDMLGVAYDAPQQEVKIAARQLAAVWHPDFFVSRLPPDLLEVMTRRTQEVNNARDTLSTEDRRWSRRQPEGTDPNQETASQSGSPPPESSGQVLPGERDPLDVTDGGEP